MVAKPSPPDICWHLIWPPTGLEFGLAGNVGGGEEGDKTIVHTKEQADHSLPYCIALVLVDGAAGVEGFTEARTTYGVIGVKCWVYKGEILPTKKRESQAVGAF